MADLVELACMISNCIAQINISKIVTKTIFYLFFTSKTEIIFYILYQIR